LPFLADHGSIRAAETSETVEKFAGFCWCTGCEWQGPVRDTYDQALTDAESHNPPDGHNRGVIAVKAPKKKVTRWYYICAEPTCRYANGPHRDTSKEAIRDAKEHTAKTGHDTEIMSVDEVVEDSQGLVQKAIVKAKTGPRAVRKTTRISPNLLRTIRR
jgi:hypothetical protein